jgi:glutathione S-transferase
MTPTSDATAKTTIVGRSSSHFTRIPRIFAAEAGVDYAFRPVFDILSLDPADYAGNPALKLPVLETPDGSWFGALNVCRELVRRSHRRPRVVWPEDLVQPLLANAQELVLHAMATEVSLIMPKVAKQEGGGAHTAKMTRSLENVLLWLDGNVASALAGLPGERDLSYLEASLFCLVTHLEFREVVPTEPYPALRRFRDEFGRRPSAAATQYRFDEPPSAA